jgi:hypothetical protein
MKPTDSNKLLNVPRGYSVIVTHINDRRKGA